MCRGPGKKAANSWPSLGSRVGQRAGGCWLEDSFGSTSVLSSPLQAMPQAQDCLLTSRGTTVDQAMCTGYLETLGPKDVVDGGGDGGGRR